MSFKVTWLGHASFACEIDGHKVLIDPFLTGNPAASTDADSLEADFILISHGHGDHVGDAESIAKRTDAKVISNFEIANWFSSQGVSNVHAQHIGGGFTHDFGYLKLTIAHHGSGLPDGTYGGNPAGFLITLKDGKKVYFACDTALFLDLRLIGTAGIDLAVVPIGDLFTMGPEDSIEAIKMLAPKRVAPAHYNTWPPIEQDAAGWAERVRAHTQAEPIVLEPGGRLTL